MAASQVCLRSRVNLSQLWGPVNEDTGSRVCNATCINSLCLQNKHRVNLGRRLSTNAGRYNGGPGSCSKREVVARAVQKVLEGKQSSKGSSEGATSEVEFEWMGEANEVLVTGSFVKWEEKVPLERTGGGAFKGKMALPAGAHQYKFVVDGEWRHREDLETVSDGTGGVNNQVVVQEPKPAKKEASAKTDTEPKAEEKAEKQGSTPTPDELQAIAVKAPPPGEKPEPIEKTIAKVTGKDEDKKETKSSEEPEKPAAAKPSPKAAKKVEAPAGNEEKPKPKAAAPKPKAKAAPAGEDADNGAPSADATPKPKAKPAAKGKAGKKAGKAPQKPLNELMQEDVVPMLAATLEKENVTDVELVWENNELRGCFVNGGVPYCFWAFFPDGKLEGSRGFSLTSHGYPPSTIEPFFVDEKATGMTPEMMVFWIRKRLFAQKSALPKLN